MSSCVAGVECEAPGEFPKRYLWGPCATLMTTGYLQRSLLDPTEYIDLFDEPGMSHRNSF